MTAPRVPLVLLAEDDGPMRALVALHLRAEGIEVVDVNDAFELRAYFDGCRRSAFPYPDVLVTDVRMPGGWDAATLGDRPYRCPVVLMTALLDAEAREVAARLGAAEIFVKPFPLKALVATIRRSLGPRAVGPELPGAPEGPTVEAPPRPARRLVAWRTKAAVG